MSNVEEYRNKADALCEGVENFGSFKIWRHETYQQYHDRFISLNQVMERTKGNLVLEDLIDDVAVDAEHPTKAERASALERLKAL